MAKENDAPTEIETITLTMSRPVAEAVQAACEWYLRLHMGQFWDVADDLCMAKFYSDAKHNEFKTKEQRDNAFTVSIHRRNDMQREFYDATGVFPYGWYECPVCGYRTDWEPHACPICHTLLEP